MKGTVVKAMQEMVEDEHGSDTWEDILESSELEDNFSATILSDIEDDKFRNLLSSAADVLGVSEKEAMDTFSHYFIQEYAPDTYGIYYTKADSARDFLLNMDDVHEQLTKNMNDAKPPRFDYEEKDDGSISMTYNSDRGMFELFKSLAYAVGEYFGDDLEIRETGSDTVEIRFS